MAPVPATRGRNQWHQGNLAEAEQIRRSALKSSDGEQADRHGGRFATEAVLGQLLLHTDRHQEARARLEAALRAPTRKATVLPWVYFSLGKLAQAIDDEDLLEEARRSIVAADALAGGTGAPEALQALLAEH